MKSKLDYIITEAIDNLLLEEFGVIKDLEPLGDFIINKFFTAIVSNSKVSDGMVKNDLISFSVTMDEIKNSINCKNWYGIDRLEKFNFKTVAKFDGEIAAVGVDDETADLIPIIEINISPFYTSRMIKFEISRIGFDAFKKQFYTNFKPSIMHELTHLIEIVNSMIKGSFRYPAYTCMYDYPELDEIRNISFAFSETEINARVTTMYYNVIESSYFKSMIDNWEGSRTELCKKIIDETNPENWADKMKEFLDMVDDAIHNNKEDGLNFLRDFIDINRQAAFVGTKNVFNLKWKREYGNEKMITSWDDGEKSLKRKSQRLYYKMYKMYNTYLRKLYNAVNNAIDDVKNEQTSQL